MIEQTGSIFFECKYGFFHTSKYNDIIIRGKNLEVLKNNYKGLVQLISLLPKSYPGNSILTEDLGIIHGEDNCKCGNFGKYFTIEGRIQNSDVEVAVIYSLSLPNLKVIIGQKKNYPTNT